MGDIHMNIKSNKVLALSLVSLLSVVPALQAWRPSMPSCPSFISTPAYNIAVRTKNGYNHSKDGVTAAAVWTKDKAVAGSYATGRGIKNATVWTKDKAVAGSYATGRGIRVASAWSLDKSKAGGRHLLDNKKKYAAATTGAVLAALACMHPAVVRDFLQAGYQSVVNFPYGEKTKAVKAGVSSLWKRVRG